MNNNPNHVKSMIGDWNISMAGVTSSLAKTTFFVYVENVDAAYRRALAQGATPVAAPENKSRRERSAEVLDTDGNHWKFYSYNLPMHTQ